MCEIGPERDTEPSTAESEVRDIAPAALPETSPPDTAALKRRGRFSARFAPGFLRSRDIDCPYGGCNRRRCASTDELDIFYHALALSARRGHKIALVVAFHRSGRYQLGGRRTRTDFPKARRCLARASLARRDRFRNPLLSDAVKRHLAPDGEPAGLKRLAPMKCRCGSCESKVVAPSPLKGICGTLAAARL